MISLTPTFLFELSNTAKGIPEGNDTILCIPYLKASTYNPKDISFRYEDKEWDHNKTTYVILISTLNFFYLEITLIIKFPPNRGGYKIKLINFKNFINHR